MFTQGRVDLLQFHGALRHARLQNLLVAFEGIEYRPRLFIQAAGKPEGRQFDAVTRRMPAGPVAQGGGVAAGGVGGGGFGQQFAHRVGGLLGELGGQGQGGRGLRKGWKCRIIFHSMYVVLRF